MNRERVILVMTLITVAIMLVSGKILATSIKLYNVTDAILFLVLWGIVTRISHLILLKIGTRILSKSSRTN